MKFLAVSASLPLLDWRALRSPSERMPSVDPARLRGQPFLKNFGPSGARSSVRIPSRPAETIFFEARRAVQLPRYLPGQNPAARVLRRVYVGGPQVRFDIAMFASLDVRSLRHTRYRKAAKDWWSSPVRIKQRDGWHDVTLHDAQSLLASRFRDETQRSRTSKGPSAASDITSLPPQVILLGFVQPAEVPRTAILLNDSPRVWLMSDTGMFRGTLKPDTDFVFIEEVKGRHVTADVFSLIRRIRRELIWLHADFSFLIEVGRSVQAERHATPLGLKEAREVADGLSQLAGDQAWGFAPTLLRAWTEARANELALLRAQVGRGVSAQTPLPEWFRHPRVEVPEERRVYLQTLQHRVETRANDYPENDALALGHVGLVDRRLLEGQGADAAYLKERLSVFAFYFAQPPRARKTISIVIPVRGAVFPLMACLQGIAAQSLVRSCPEDVELLIVEDEPADANGPIVLRSEIAALLKGPELARVHKRCFTVSSPLRLGNRAFARNVGIFRATRGIVMFLDASMILDEHHLAEHIIRHQRVPNIALLGFKENLMLSSLGAEGLESARASLGRDPDPRQDWKWRHVITDDEVDEDGFFRFRGAVFRSGEIVNYMQLTNYLRGLKGGERIGPRALTTFFQTNIVSVSRRRVEEVGGFDAAAFNDNLWGLEDSHLGALLVANGVCLVPCPSASAFKVEHSESPDKRQFDLVRHRQLYLELLQRPMWTWGPHETEDQILAREKDGLLRELRREVTVSA